MTASQMADGSHTFRVRVVDEVTRHDILANQTVSLRPQRVNEGYRDLSTSPRFEGIANKIACRQGH